MTEPITADQVQRILDEHPLLNAHGVGRGNGSPKDRYEAVMAEPLRGVRLEEVEAARDWLTSTREPRKTFSGAASSYHWKHVMERDGAGYVTNGAFIVACYLAGFPVAENDGFNPRCGIRKEPRR
ncbi:hypothetical protein [Cryptosporangium phraense]|uniref:Uncharacterized protein n=1 Tax=Cryptosporangium phraense TaxID=2593070 RepID=A0A545ASP5_9ACTN|nr:hypothetical protein [Cryptosporangium phraense]TQS44349.1 hypothetical protein FL583_15565 [Cryptosporangium phraense]